MKTHSHANVADFFGQPVFGFVHDLVAQSKIIYIHRDGRDTMTSLFYYLRGIGGFFPVDAPFADFLRMPNELDSTTYAGQKSRPAYWKFHVEGWLARNDVLVLSFEQFIHSFASVLEAVAEFIELPLQKAVDTRRRQQSNVEAIIARMKNCVFANNPRFTSVTFRKGKSGDWRNHFSLEDMAFFEQESGGILTRLGYPQETGSR